MPKRGRMVCGLKLSKCAAHLMQRTGSITLCNQSTDNADCILGLLSIISLAVTEAWMRLIGGFQGRELLGAMLNIKRCYGLLQLLHFARPDDGRSYARLMQNPS